MIGWAVARGFCLSTQARGGDEVGGAPEELTPGAPTSRFLQTAGTVVVPAVSPHRRVAWLP